MRYTDYLLVIVYFVCLASHQQLSSAAPLSSLPDDFCNENTLLKHEIGTGYVYDYSTKTTLWINDVSEESKSHVELKAQITIQSVSKCLYSLRIDSASLVGATIDQKLATEQLEYLKSKSVQFRMNSNGEIHSAVDFSKGDQPWSRNIKRGILSALQTKSVKDLRSIEGEARQSAVVYETDVLGRCRTTYSSEDDLDDTDIVLNKKKSLHGCTLNENSKTSAIQYVPYKNIPEFNQGKLFIEEYECNTTVKNNIINSVDCDEESTYKIGSVDKKGVQAKVRQSLKYKSKRAGPETKRIGAEFETMEIAFEYTDKSVDELEFKDFNVDKFLADICDMADKKVGLDLEHTNNYRSLVNKIESYTEENLLKLHADANRKCSIAGSTVANALVFANTENSFQAVLKLMDKDEFATSQYITEFPLLTALARNQNPSLAFLKKFKAYVASKDAKFAYLRKLILIYSTLIKSHCSNNQCDKATLDDLSSVLVPNLGSDCSDVKNKDLVATTLKAIGNIGHIKDSTLLVKCAKNVKNTMEVRVSAVQAFRRFSCDKIIANGGIQDIIKDTNGDAELRISTFQMMIQCTETEEYKLFAQNQLVAFLENEKDIQVLTYIIDYAKEHGITSILNAILSSPTLKEKYSVNFKEVSWNNYKYKYSFLKDGAVEVETSIIFDTRKAFIPRSIRLNVTTHMFGMSVNFLDAQIRLEGLDEIAKLSLINKLKSDELIKKFIEAPEKLIDLLQIVMSKLQYRVEKPYLSLLLRVYGSDVFFSEIDEVNELKKLTDLIASTQKNFIYENLKYLKNMLLVDSRIRQPLLNGFEFNTFMDVSLSYLVSKNTSRDDSKELRKLKIDNLYSGSVSINKRFEIQLNKAMKLALKKKAILNARLNLNAESERKNGSLAYTLNFMPKAETPLIVLNGRFYKLTSSSAYTEITNFETEEVRVQRCLSQNFLDSVGLSACLSMKYPANTDSLLNSLIKPLDFTDEMDDDLEENEDDDEFYRNYNAHRRREKSPSMLLAGPYNLEIKLKNPQMLKSLIFRSEMSKDNHVTNFKGKLQSKSASNKIEDKLNLSYLRKQNQTNLLYESLFNVTLSRANSDDKRFQLRADLTSFSSKFYHLNLNLENQLLSVPFHTYLEYKFEAPDRTPIPTLRIKSGYGIMGRQRTLALNLAEQDGNSLVGNVTIQKADEWSDFKLENVMQSLLQIKSIGLNEMVYAIDYKLNTKNDMNKLHIYGKTELTRQFYLNLSMDYETPEVNIREPNMLRVSHELDYLGEVSVMVAEVNLKVPLPRNKIDHGIKLIYKSTPMGMQRYAEIQVSTPNTRLNSKNLPYTIYAGDDTTSLEDDDIDADSESEIKSIQKLGINNFKVNLLPLNKYDLVNSIAQLDNDYRLRSFEIRFEKTEKPTEGLISYKAIVNKNNVEFTKIEALKRGSSLESILPKGSLGVEFNFKIFKLKGLTSANLSLAENSYAIVLAAEDFFESVFKFVSMKSAVSLNTARNEISAEYKVVRNSSVKVFRMEANKAKLRELSKGINEFDIVYEKVLQNGTSLKANGVVRFSLNGSDNFETSVDVKGHYGYKMSLTNEKNAQVGQIGYHEFYYKSTDMDFMPVEHEYKLLVSNKTEQNLNNIYGVLLARKGALGQLDNVDKLDYLVDYKLDSTSNGDVLTQVTDKLAFKSKRLNMEYYANATIKLDLQQLKLSAEANSLSKRGSSQNPSMKTFWKEHTMFNYDLAAQTPFLKYSFETDQSSLVKSFQLDYSSETDSLKDFTFNCNLTTIADEKKQIQIIMEKVDCESEDKPSCTERKIRIKQDLKPQFETNIQVVDLKECVLTTRYASSYRDALLVSSLKCNQVKLFNNSIETAEHFDGSSSIKLAMDSDVFYKKQSYQVAVKDRGPRSSLLEIKVRKEDAAPDAFSDFLISFDREVNSTTGRLSAGNYKWTLGFGKQLKKCQMNIQSKESNYLNKIDCELTLLRTQTTTKTYKYGCELELQNRNEWDLGKRDVRVDLNLPSKRQLRVTYVSSRAVQMEAVDLNDNEAGDDQEDENHEREFNSTLSYFWDYAKDKSKYLTLVVKRENYERAKSRLSAELKNLPNMNGLRVELDRQRLFNQTAINLAVLYELKKDEVKNRLDLTSIMSSDLDSNTLSLEANLLRPQLNVFYFNKFNKHNGRLELLQVRLAKLIKLIIDKETDVENRKIRVELVKPADGGLYSVDTKETNVNGVLSVVSSLKKSGTQLSKLESKFDSNNNNLKVLLNDKYQLDLGVYSEKLASAELKNLKDNSKLVVILLKVFTNRGVNNLQLNLKSKRFWSLIKQEILKAKGDQAGLYTTISSDLGKLFASVRFDTDRKAVRKDLGELLSVSDEFYQLVFTQRKYANLKLTLKSKLQDYSNFVFNRANDVQTRNLTLNRRLLAAYQGLATNVNSVYSVAPRSTKDWPRLPLLSLNNSSAYDLDVVITRPVYYSGDLYQLNAEYRNGMRKMADRILSLKKGFIHNMQEEDAYTNIRPLTSYTVVGQVFNRRNLIKFSGDSKILKAKCTYLLAHDLVKNRFSIVLNNNDQEAVITVYAYGQEPIHLGYSTASIGNRKLALPYNKWLEAKSVSISVKKIFNGIGLHIGSDILVYCFEDSKSCKIATTRFYTGKINGLLGRSSYDLEDVDEDYWYLERTCKKPANTYLIQSSEQAIKTCYATFGRDRKTTLKNAMEAIKPNGWHKLCETVLTVNPDLKCMLIKSYVQYSGIKSIDADEPEECYQCKLNDKSYAVDQYVDDLVNTNDTSDYVFMFLPCDHSRIFTDLVKNVESLQKEQKKNPHYASRRYHFVKVDQYGASVYQSEKGETYNFDIKQALQQMSEPRVSIEKKEPMHYGLVLANRIFANRLATNRHLILVSCGNCPSYSSLSSLDIGSHLNSRNIKVTALGDYKFTANSLFSEKNKFIFGYGYGNSLVYSMDTLENEVKMKSKYLYFELDNNVDMCTRLASETYGHVISINEASKAMVFGKVAEEIQKEEISEENLFTINTTCRKVKTPFGVSYTDFQHKRIVYLF